MSIPTVFIVVVYAFVVIICAVFFVNKAMAEGGIPVGEGDSSPKTDETFSEPEPLTVAVVLAMSVDELRTELRQRNVIITGVTKPELQEMLLRELSIIKSGEGSMVGILEEEAPFSSPELVAPKSPHAPVAPVVPELGARPKVPPASTVPDYTLPQPARSRSPTKENESMRALELKLELKRLEIEASEKAQALELADRDKQRQFELRKLELQAAPAHAPPISAPRVPTPAFRVESAVKLIPEFDENDVETFLITFEKIAGINKFPSDKYAAILQAHLKGKALKVFTELSLTECQDYKLLKAALLTAYSVVPEVYRKRFRESRKFQSETYSEFAFRLSTQFKRWVESEQAYDRIEVLRELIMMEQFNSHIEPVMRGWLIDQKPQSLSQLARLADQYLAVHQVDRNELTGSGHSKTGYGPSKPPWHKLGSSKPSQSSQQVGVEGNVKTPSSPPKPSSSFTGQPRSKVICYYCKKPGHVMATCHKRLAKLSGVHNQHQGNNAGNQGNPIQLVHTEQPRTLVVEVDPRFKSHCVNAVLIRPDKTSYSVQVLRDTGALQSLVSSEVLHNDDFVHTGETRLICGITGDTISVPLVEVTLDSVLCSGTYMCGLVATLPAGIALLIGNDLCNEPGIAHVNVVTRSMAAAMATKPEETLEGEVVTDSPEVKSNEEVRIEQSPDTDSPSEDVLSDIPSLFDEFSPSVGNLNREQLIELQKNDASLASIYDLVDRPGHNYLIRSGVLLRKWCDDISPPSAAIHQIVVPTLLRAELLHIAHAIPAAGHLGVAKTKARLVRHFYWPGISRDVKEFCRTCDICQRLGKGPSPAVAPLHSIPLVSEPFCQIAIDIVGPLPPCKDTGNRFILTVLDLCTHYPEAIPLTHHTAQDVAKALSTVFSRFGFPQEILSDQGSDFMSELMQVFLNEFGISQIRTSPYHPQTNGACERFNGTLKSMLRSLTGKFPDSWDDALPWVLFAYREVPVETLGYSPFDLLFGRSVAGPLALLKSSWLHDTDLSTAKQNVVEFVLNTREQLRHAVEAATEHATEQRNKAKVWYDRRAVNRVFSPGEKVMVLLPVPGKPMHAKYHGPYAVVDQIGPVDYVIATPDRRKTKRVCHVNLLKKYFERSLRLEPQVEQPVPEVVGLVDSVETEPIKVADSHLESQQKTELHELLTEFSDIFSNEPGRTTLVNHHINLKPDVAPIRSAPYRLSPDKLEFVKEEIETLKKQGIVEDAPSDCSWAAPIVVVKKADGGWRLCTDYRKLNASTEPDPFPLPRIDDLLDKIGKAKFLTKVDMAKGYYQVPMDKESIPLTGFVTPFGFFRWKYMPFGLRNAPATFSRLVQGLLYGMETFCVAYLDDILIFSENWSDHLKHLNLVFTRVREAKLTLKLSKCEFAAAELDFLGHHVGLGKLLPREQKVKALIDFPRPPNRKGVQRFLGLAGYFRRFIPHYSDLSRVLSDLLKKDRKFVWTDACEQAFVDIKSRLASRPILRPPNYDLPFCMAVDASDMAVGACLFQVLDGIEHPICYLSKKLNKHQLNYSTVEKEAFGLLLATRAFSVYFGSAPVTVYTDHSPLQFLQRMSNHNQKLLRWNLELQEYNLVIKHRPGRDNILPDLLSRPQ